MSDEKDNPAEDAKLMEAFDKAVPEGAPVKAEKPVEEPEKEAQPEAEAAADKQGETPEAEEGSETDESGDPDLERAWAALERDGWRKSEIKKLGVESIKALGLKRAKNQDEVDAVYKDLKAIKAERSAEKPAAQRNDTVDAADDLSGDLKAFEELYGPEGAKALKAIHAKVAKVEAALQERSANESQREAKRIRGEVSALYPETKGDVAWNAVIVAAQQIAERDDVADAEAAITKALTEVFGARKPKPAPLKAERLGDLPESPARKAKSVPASKDEREWAAFNTIVEGGDRTAATKAYQGG